MENDEKTKYSNTYLVYARKSTDDKDNQKNSISYQKAEILRFADREHLSIANIDIDGFCTNGVITERHTGFKEDEFFTIGKNGTIHLKIERPKFFRLVELLHQGRYKGAIFLCMDRASRNKTDDGILDKLRKRGIDLRYVQATYDKTSAGELHMDIDRVFSGHYSRAIKEKVTNTIRKLRDEGVCTYRGPVGYINTGDMRLKPFDMVRAPIIKQVAEKYSDGTWSLNDLAKWANEQGLTMPPMRRRRTREEKNREEDIEIEPIARPVTANHIHKILRNPFYLGFTLGNNGRYVKSVSHKALFSKKLFDKVQEVLRSKRVSIHYVQKPEFPYRGLVRCELCKRVYTPYEKKGINYYSARCLKGCGNQKRSINDTFIVSGTEEIISQLRHTNQQLSEIDRRLPQNGKQQEMQQQKEREARQRQERTTRENLAYLNANKLMLIKSGVYTTEQFIQEERKLEKQIQEIEQNAQKSITIPEYLKTSIKYSELAKTLYIWYEKAKPDEKALYLRNIFSELKISEKRLIYKTKSAFEILELPFILMGDPITRISELTDTYDVLKNSLAELEILVSDIQKDTYTQE